MRRNEGRTKWLLGVCLLLAAVVMFFSFRNRYESEAKSNYEKLTPNLVKLKKGDRANKIVNRTGNASFWIGRTNRKIGLAILHSSVPCCRSATRFITSMLGTRSAGSNGILSFQLQAKDSDTLHEVEKTCAIWGTFQIRPAYTRQRPPTATHFEPFDLLIPDKFDHDIKSNLETNSPPPAN